MAMNMETQLNNMCWEILVEPLSDYLKCCSVFLALILTRWLKNLEFISSSPNRFYMNILLGRPQPACN